MFLKRVENIKNEIYAVTKTKIWVK